MFASKIIYLKVAERNDIGQKHQNCMHSVMQFYAQKQKTKQILKIFYWLNLHKRASQPFFSSQIPFKKTDNYIDLLKNSFFRIHLEPNPSNQKLETYIFFKYLINCLSQASTRIEPSKT